MRTEKELNETTEAKFEHSLANGLIVVPPKYGNDNMENSRIKLFFVSKFKGLNLRLPLQI